MDDLSTGRCLPCEGGQPPLTPEQIQQYRVQLPEWSLNESKTAISRRFSFKGFQKTISFINAIAWIVNQENHHPTLEAGYDYCISYFHYPCREGLTPNDFICAAKIDKLL